MVMEITKTLYVKDRASWRKWLRENHSKEKEIWLIYYKKHTGKPRINYIDMVKEELCFGWIDGIVKRMDDEKYAQRITPRRKNSGWSANNVRLYLELEKQGLVTKAGRRAFEAKSIVYTPNMIKGGVKWHQENRMPKNPTLKERIEWHMGHQKHCGCRPVPKSILPHIPRNSRK